MENAIIKTEYGTAGAENGTIIYTPEEIQRIEDFREAAILAACTITAWPCIMPYNILQVI